MKIRRAIDIVTVRARQSLDDKDNSNQDYRLIVEACERLEMIFRLPMFFVSIVTHEEGNP